MNIFILDNDLDTNAKYHVDKHVVKMPLEAAQMLCTNMWIDEFLGYKPHKLEKPDLDKLTEITSIERKLPQEERTIPYLPAMTNHPCTIWARSSEENFYYLYNYMNALNDEKVYRYGTPHKSAVMLRDIRLPKHMENHGLTPFAQAMPDECKHEDAVTAYRTYYRNFKSHIFGWKGRLTPSFVCGNGHGPEHDGKTWEEILGA